VNEYLTVAAVAHELGVSMRTVQRWVERGDLAAVRLPGGRLRIARRDLDAAVARWRTPPPGRILAA
jgi:excisionase family DNA binding protein